MSQTNSIVLGGGCFWCLDAAYRRVKGVTRVSSGYTGGETPNPSYEQVSSGTTGHVEVVSVTFDPELISLETLLELFWTLHDPTTLNRQGADVGSQYASVIFYSDEAQHDVAEASLGGVQELFDRPIVTKLRPLGTFYEAEAYHQDYFANNQNAGYCSFVIEPKLAKLREHFADLLSEPQ